MPRPNDKSTSRPHRSAAATVLHYARRPRGPRRYPVWSARWLFAMFMVGLIATFTLLLVFDNHKRFIRDMEITVVVVAGMLFAMLTIGLYSGARVRKREDMAGELKTIGSLKDLGNSDAGGCLEDRKRVV